ncbi:unnamed protein product [Linum trigynum]|uniref:Uncharacterized protein n=1 Tax=Linum trigynum TaxID=586398 RepID=A0AAV2E1I0_9ROSI
MAQSLLATLFFSSPGPSPSTIQPILPSRKKSKKLSTAAIVLTIKQLQRRIQDFNDHKNQLTGKKKNTTLTNINGYFYYCGGGPAVFGRLGLRSFNNGCGNDDGVLVLGIRRN